MRLRFGRTLAVLAGVVAAAMILAACPVSDAPTPPFIMEGVDFSGSAYKHINNGGVGGDGVMPYNVDAITGATVTVEGPGVVTSIPLSMREIENRDGGLVRGSYIDATGHFIYEGLDLYYLLYEMVDGDNGILLTDTAYSVALKDANRADVASFTIAEVVRAHEDGRPILLAYGMGTLDEATAAPFVFDAANEAEKSAGYIEVLDNGDGCLKLVYDLDAYGENTDYVAFTNVAYIYLREQAEPGFKHTGSGRPAYSASRFTDYIITFRGAALGRELDFTVGQLEQLVAHREDDVLVEGGVGYSDFYSLANNAYWYVNEYEGLDLYKLLLYLGMEDAETMGLAAARTTLVSFVAGDGVESPESFSVDTLSYPDAFGFYNKNAVDPGDGSYKPTNADLVRTGYPVLLAYGVNRYPYTIAKGEAGYLSGLSNSGGPMRVVFGKTQYNHANGSNQVQYLKDVIVGQDILYNTHTYTDDAAQKALADQELSIRVTGEDGQVLLERAMTVGQIEDIVYGAGVAKGVKRAASVKDSYQALVGGQYQSDIYEGISLPHFLLETLGLPGVNGTITLVGAQGSRTLKLDAVMGTGYHTELGRDGLPALLAFAKNGAPMVAGAGRPGYVDAVALRPFSQHEPGTYRVDNGGGPLAVLVPSSDPDTPNGASVLELTGIEITLIPDAYAHIRAPYSDLAQSELRLYGDGLEQERVYTVAELEAKQTAAKTLDYSVQDAGGGMAEQRYRGLGLYDLFTETGIRSNAGAVIVHTADGASHTFSLSDIKRRSGINVLSPHKPPLFAMLAFGAGDLGSDTMDGFPLVASPQAEGYSQRAGNDGGPLKLIVPQEGAAALCVGAVVAVEVTANEIDTWGHHMSDIYEEFLDYPFTFTLRNDDSEWSHVFTLAQLEAMSGLIVRDSYSVLDIGECEGVAIWKLIQLVAGDVAGASDPVAVTVYAEDGYKNDLLSVFYKEGLELGVANADGERKPLILAYAVNGLPLVDNESHEGYTGLAGNMGGPLRTVAETVQGASVKYVNKLVVTLPGGGPIEVDTSRFLQ